MKTSRIIKKRPPRLERVFGDGSQPLYFITINTLKRRPILDSEDVHAALRRYGEMGVDLGAAMGRYVIMPDHVHVFVRLEPQRPLQQWDSGLKRGMGKVLSRSGLSPWQIPGQSLKSFWQPGFFDHALRSDESYAEKWAYVHENPVRAGLVTRAEDWPYQGEIVVIDRA